MRGRKIITKRLTTTMAAAAAAVSLEEALAPLGTVQLWLARVARAGPIEPNRVRQWAYPFVELHYTEYEAYFALAHWLRDGKALAPALVPLWQNLTTENLREYVAIVGCEAPLLSTVRPLSLQGDERRALNALGARDVAGLQRERAEAFRAAVAALCARAPPPANALVLTVGFCHQRGEAHTLYTEAFYSSWVAHMELAERVAVRWEALDEPTANTRLAHLRASSRPCELRQCLAHWRCDRDYTVVRVALPARATPLAVAPPEDLVERERRRRRHTREFDAMWERFEQVTRRG